MTDEGLNGHLYRINQRFDAIDQRFDVCEARLINAMRDVQTELLRSFDAIAAPLVLRLRKVEADQSNLDASLSGRVEILERRLLQIEQRLGGAK
jgi:hypothetical protein